MITHTLTLVNNYNLDNLMQYGEHCLVVNRHINKESIWIEKFGWLHYGQKIECEHTVEGEWKVTRLK